MAVMKLITKFVANPAPERYNNQGDTTLTNQRRIFYMENLNVQDNRVLKYAVDFEKSELVLHTRSEDKVLTDIVFSGMAAYLFEDTIMGCIILDLEEWPVEDFISYLGENYLQDHQKYGWPFEYNDLDGFKRKIAEKDITIYNLASSYGMSGFILAKSVKYISKGKS